MYLCTSVYIVVIMLHAWIKAYTHECNVLVRADAHTHLQTSEALHIKKACPSANVAASRVRHSYVDNASREVGAHGHVFQRLQRRLRHLESTLCQSCLHYCFAYVREQSGVWYRNVTIKIMVAGEASLDFCGHAFIMLR